MAVSREQYFNSTFHCYLKGLSYVLGKADEALIITRTVTRKSEETKKKVGYIKENTFRRRLTEEVLPWAKNFRFDSPSEQVEWVGLKLNQSNGEMQLALVTIVKLCIVDISGYLDPETFLEIPT